MTNRFDFKIAVIGCGNIANIQLKYITKYIRKENIALCDKNQTRMGYLSEKFGILNNFEDINLLLTKFKPQIIHILTPPYTHKDIAILCLKSGCHVFIEKPVCLSGEESEEIIQVSDHHNCFVCVDHTRLFDPQIIKIKKMIESGRFGEIVNIVSQEADNYLDRKNEGLSPKWLTDLPGEIFSDILPHHLSVLYEFLPDLKLESAVCQKNEKNEIINLNCLFSAPNQTANLRMSLATYPLQNQVIFECTKGNIIADFRNSLTIAIKKSSLPGLVERIWNNIYIGTMFIGGTVFNIFKFLRGKLDSYAGMDNIIRSFYESIQNNSDSPVSNKNILSVTKSIESIFQNIPMLSIQNSENKSHLQDAEILVTGGTGFIGKKLVKRLLEKGHKVRVLTHRKINENEVSSLPKGNIEFYSGDISNPNDVENACNGVSIVYHLAAATKGNWLYHLDSTVSGTKNILDACVRNKVKHLVYVSTIGVLNATKYPEHEIINEDFPYEENPEKRGFYSESKLKAEQIVLQYKDNLSISVIRPGLVYGPGRDLISLFGKKLSKRLVLIQGKNNNIIPLVYVENLVDALILAAESKETGIYNAVDDDRITVREFIKSYKKITAENFFTIQLGSIFFKPIFWLADRALSIIQGNSSLMYKINVISRTAVHSTEGIKNRLGWNPQISFEKGMNETIISLGLKK